MQSALWCYLPVGSEQRRVLVLQQKNKKVKKDDQEEKKESTEEGEEEEKGEDKELEAHKATLKSLGSTAAS